jgi:hypothetical protein
MTLDFDYDLHTFRSPKFQSVVEDAVKFFTETPLHPLPPTTQFIGSGVYGLYYLGGYELYTKIVATNREAQPQPIYMGKAVPPGWRTARGKDRVMPDLSRRLREHARSIRQTANLQLEDFQCRFMILSNVESDLIGPVEAALIRKYRPLWNTVVDGFGNHDPGAGRYNQARSEWDVLHPGRLWAERLTGESPSLENIITKIKKLLD